MARHEEDFRVSVERVPDRNFFGTPATAARQDDDVGISEENEDRIGEPDRLQAVPIRSGMLGRVSEFAGKLNEARYRQAVTVGYFKRLNGSGRIEAVLQLHEASQRGIPGGYWFPRSCCASVDIHGRYRERSQSLES